MSSITYFWSILRYGYQNIILYLTWSIEQKIDHDVVLCFDLKELPTVQSK